MVRSPGDAVFRSSGGIGDRGDRIFGGDGGILGYATDTVGEGDNVSISKI